ncbi:MAG: type II toxin-antitoxin system RatA family toxin [Alphaproteobacteria bacterium]|nr:type II toxin-antitoxin system RatA family toxin [Alphaproteobacteria bacterium]
MLHFEEEREIALPAALLYAVVLDVGSYPLFLPWCLGAGRATAPGAGDAKPDIPPPLVSPDYWRLDVGWGPLRESYVSRVEGREAAGEVVSYAVAGPLRHLENRWRIVDAGSDAESSSLVSFSVRFSFRGILLERLAERAFVYVAREMVAAFEGRARALAAAPRLEHKHRP